ncbi:MAG: hypothetical protein M1816_007740 [Peltula sp. TS41687]|nr:MAG: hypothetical protein M1816_007740 [Peltula sp. TS41687]
MSTTQRPAPAVAGRRRSARLAFGNEEIAQSALQDNRENNGGVVQQQQQQQISSSSSSSKRMKKDGESQGDIGIVGGRSSGGSTANGGDRSESRSGSGSRAAGTGKKVAVSHDDEEEDDDGFRFTRTRSKRTKLVAQAAVPESVPEEEELAMTTNNRTGKHVNPEPKPKIKPPEKDLVVKSRRRSARVASGVVSEKPQEPRENAEEKKSGDVSDTKGSIRTTTTKKEDIRKVDEQVVVTSVQDTTKKIAIPFSDTPVIKRNKEFRQHGSKGHRRSSTGLRGRRASSLIDGGSDGEHRSKQAGWQDDDHVMRYADKCCKALPHREVGVTDFYKHIAGEGLSEPRRMKQLLTWCGTRALEDNPLHASDEDAGTLAAQVILKELLKDFSKCSEMSDWFSREETVPKAVIKKPNPRNIANAARVEELEKQVRGLREERANWESFFAAPPPTTRSTAEPTSSAISISLPPPPPAPLQQDSSSDRPPPAIHHLSEINPTLLSDPQQSTILTQLTESNSSTTTIRASTQNALQSLSSGLEFTIDRFADGIHKVGAYQTTTDRVADTVMGMLARRLEERDRSIKEKAGTSDLKLGEVLRSLARLDEGGR